MADKGNAPPFHLLLEEGEVPVARTALNLFISDQAHAPVIRPLAREVLARMDGSPDEHGIVSVSLSPAQMKITHTAVKILFDDLQRDQADEREILRRILDKLPDEHTMRAIELE